MMLYPTFSVANLIVNGPQPPVSPDSKKVPMRSRLSLVPVTAFLMTTWDLIADPMGSTQAGLWVYSNQGGVFFGVPMLNFFGWFFVTCIIIGFYLLVEAFLGIQPLRDYVPLSVNCLPLVAYFGVVLVYVLVAHPVELAVLTAFVMGFPLFLAVLGLFKGPETWLSANNINSEYRTLVATE